MFSAPSANRLQRLVRLSLGQVGTSLSIPFLIIGLAFGLSPPFNLAEAASGSTYYVATNGDDSNPGTEAQPFRIINRGASVLGPGDILYVRGGTYHGPLDTCPSGTSWANPVILMAYPGELVTIKPGSEIDLLTIQYCSYLIFDGFVFDGDDQARIVIHITSEAHHIRIQNSEIKGAQGWGGILTGDDSDFNEFINLDVHNNGTTAYDHGLYIPSSNNVIDHSSIHHNAGWGVHIYKDDCDDCANDNIVSNNAIYENGKGEIRGHGMILSSGSGNMAYNNLIWGNYIGIDLAYATSNAKVYNNVIYANSKYGINVSSESFGSEIRNNIIYQNGGMAISDGGYGTVQDHNLVETDPLFVDASAHDFHLQPSSPAIDTGIALAAVPDDFDGTSRPRGSGYDIGAFETGLIMPTPTPEPSPTSPPPSPTITLTPAETVPPTLEPTEQPEDLPTTAPAMTPTTIAHYTNTPSPSDTSQSSATHTGMATGTLIPSSTHAATTPDPVGTAGAITPSNSTTLVPIYISTPLPTDKEMPTETSAMRPTDTSLQSGTIAPTPMGNIFSRAGLGARILIENIWALIVGLSELLVDEVESSISNH